MELPAASVEYRPRPHTEPQFASTHVCSVDATTRSADPRRHVTVRPLKPNVEPRPRADAWTKSHPPSATQSRATDSEREFKFEQKPFIGVFFFLPKRGFPERGFFLGFFPKRGSPKRIPFLGFLLSCVPLSHGPSGICATCFNYTFHMCDMTHDMRIVDMCTICIMTHMDALWHV